MILVLCGRPGALRDRAVTDIRNQARAESIRFEEINLEHLEAPELRVRSYRRLLREPRRYSEAQLVVGPTTEDELTMLRALGAFVCHMYGPLPKFYNDITISPQDMMIQVGDHPKRPDRLFTPPQALMEAHHHLKTLHEAERSAKRVRA